MNAANTCPQCGGALPASTLAGLCPACLLKQGATDSGSRPLIFTPPTPAELAAQLPQLEILSLIGKGGMGAVYRARQKELDRIVALKILPPGVSGDPTFAERFAREAKALAKLNHPNIVTIYDFGRVNGLFYFVMEFVDGMSLRQLLNADRIAPREALAIVPQICDALQYAHDQGIVHRDIKPENILLDRRGRVKVADFGLAKLIFAEGGAGAPLSAAGTERTAGPAAPADLTAAGHVMGTPQYMAPEQVERPAEVDHRADIYSLGVVFYQMLTGELPKGDFAPPSKRVVVDVRLDEVVLRALEKQPERRYQQVSELKTLVETILTTPAQDSVPAPAVPVDASPATTPPAGTLSPWCRIISIAFNSTFMSSLAIKLINISALGFLGSLAFLGFVPLPGMRRCFGFSGFAGFFGLIGVASIIELAYRRKGGGFAVIQRCFIVVGRRNGKAVINWPGVLLFFVLLSAFMEGAAICMGATTNVTLAFLFTVAVILFTVAVMFTALRIRRGWTMPVDQLISLDEPAAVAPHPVATSDAPAKEVRPRVRFEIGGAFLATTFLIGVLQWYFAYRAYLTAANFHGPQPAVLVAVIGTPIALLAALGTFVFGCIAMFQIRRSAGPNRGLGLAVFDVLLFPLLALDGLIGWTWITLTRLLIDFHANPSIQNNPQIHPALVTRIANVLAQNKFEIPVLITIGMAVVVDFLIIRSVWRAASKPPGNDGSPRASSPAASQEQRSGGTPASALPERRRKVPMVGVRNGRRIVYWPGVALRLAVIPIVLAFVACLAYVVGGPRTLEWMMKERPDLLLPPVLAAVLPILMAVGIKFRLDWAKSIEKLPHLDVPQMQTPGGHARSMRNAFWSILLGLAIAEVIRVFVLAPYRAVTDAVYPEIPQDSYVFVFKLVRTYSPGDIVVYQLGGKAILGRVAQAGPAAGALQIERRNETPQSVSIANVLGRVVFNTRAEIAKKQEPAIAIVSGPPFIAHYPQGTVELVALASHTDTNAPCWGPDGMLSKERFPYSGSKSWAADKVIKEIAFRIHSRTGVDASAVLRYDKRSNVAGMGSVLQPVDSRRPCIVFTGDIACPPAARAMNVQVGVADGPWKTVTEFDATGGSTTGVDGDGIACSGVTEKDGTAVMTFTQTSTGADVRVLAIGTDGLENPSSETRSGQAGSANLITVTFRGLLPKDIRSFRIQRRRYHWVEFRNVSLQPGFKTTVESVSAAGPETQTSAPPPLSFNPAITRVKVDAQRAFIEGLGSPDSWLVLRIGEGYLSSRFLNDSPFTATYKLQAWERGINCVVKDSRGNVLLTIDNGRIGPMTTERGQIIFREGMPQPAPDGSYLIGEFRPENGASVPITARLEKLGEPRLVFELKQEKTFNQQSEGMRR